MNTTRRVFLGVGGATVGLTALHAYLNVNWGDVRNSFLPMSEIKTLTIGGLAVTCNLTLPILCAARDADTSSRRPNFEFKRYNGWPEVKESLISGQVDAAYMLAPLVMDLAAKDVPVKVVSIGHRSGAVIMVHTDSGYKKFHDLMGKRVAIPSRFAVDYLYLRKMLAKEGMTDKDVKIVEMAPADMPAAMYAKAIDAYCTGEPFGAAAQRAGYAVPLSMSRDAWPNYLCCVLTVRQVLIDQNPSLVQDLVDYVQGAGHWLDAKPANRTRAAVIASDKKYFNQDEAIIQYVMDNPPDRVTFGDLRMIKSEFDEMMELSIQAGTLAAPVPYEKYADERFVKKAKPASILL